MLVPMDGGPVLRFVINGSTWVKLDKKHGRKAHRVSLGVINITSEISGVIT